ncbi:MAG: hypothetical protein KKC79_16520, partial [Gammaproteobacteria bacterium]|nr:hypothetical protein [Gammaproteobacteria bacterium]
MSSPVPGAPVAADTPERTAGPVPDEPHASFVGALFWIAVVFSAFQIATAAFSPLSSSVVRAVHVGFLLLIVFVMHPPFRQQWLGWAIGIAAFCAGLYHWVNEADLIQRAGDLTSADMVVGVLTIVLVF